MFKSTTPSCREYNTCSRRNRCKQCRGACKVASTCQKGPKCNCKAFKKGCPCQPVELCKRQCRRCLPGGCEKCLLQPGCPSKFCKQKCKCQFALVCSCGYDPTKICKKRCAPEGKYPACPVQTKLPQELPRKRCGRPGGCCPSVDLFVSRLGMGDVILQLTPPPTTAFQLKPLTLREQSKCVATPKVNPCPNTPCKCPCGA